MIAIAHFQASDVDELDFQESQVWVPLRLNPDVIRAVEGPDSFTVRDEVGKVLMCAGVVLNWSGYGQGWALVSKDAGAHMLAITRAARRYFTVCPYDRVEALVDCEFEAGHRWMRALGFERETPSPMKKTRHDGGSSFLYARVR